MADEYSLYDAKAQLSALIRQVREGRTFVITVHGQPAAELRPVDTTARPQSLESRIEELDGRGIIFNDRRTPNEPKSFPVGARKTGALKRFLDERE